MSDNRQDIETLKKRYQQLNDKRVATKANLETAEARLDKLKADARRDFGTDDVTELKARLAEMHAENERKRAEYQAHLDDVTARLSDVENRHRTTEQGL